MRRRIRGAAGARRPAAEDSRGPAWWGATARGRPAPAAATTKHARASDLAAQNDLFDEALATEHGGDPRGAVALLDRFLARYPASPLAENAQAERMKVLAKIDHERAREAARAYLEA